MQDKVLLDLLLRRVEGNPKSLARRDAASTPLASGAVSVKSRLGRAKTPSQQGWRGWRSSLDRREEIESRLKGTWKEASAIPHRVNEQFGYILRSWSWSETSLVLDVLTQDYGRVFLVAKGAKRRTCAYRSYLIPFCPLRFSWSGKTEVKQLRDVQWMGTWEIRSGSALMAGYYLNELLLKLLPREFCQWGLFERYTEVLYELVSHPERDLGPLLRSFEWDFLSMSGWLPSVHPAPETLSATDDVVYVVDGGELVSRPRFSVEEGMFAFSPEAVQAYLAGAFDQAPHQSAFRDIGRALLESHLPTGELQARRVLSDLIRVAQVDLERTTMESSVLSASKEKTVMSSENYHHPLGPVCVDIAGLTLTPHEIERLKHPLTGMVILFSRNYQNREQLKALTEAIHQARPGILISVDHEGGRVQRFREGFTEVPAMGELRRRDKAMSHMEAAGLVLAAELRECGVDLTFAPVLDVDYGRSKVIGDRSLGTTPFEVTENARAFISGLRQGGMASCGKHFPGHGWAEADSHVALPTDERPLEELLRDMRAYRKLPELDSIMTAHVSYAAFDGELATFCPRLLKDVLRDRLGFKGLVFSDDLTMKAAAADTITERAQRALSAGCDMVLVCNDPDAADELLATLAWERTPEFDRRLSRLAPMSPVSWRLVNSSREFLMGTSSIDEQTSVL